jgi:hypothetical protein
MGPGPVEEARRWKPSLSTERLSLVFLNFLGPARHGEGRRTVVSPVVVVDAVYPVVGLPCITCLSRVTGLDVRSVS